MQNRFFFLLLFIYLDTLVQFSAFIDLNVQGQCEKKEEKYVNKNRMQ